MADDLEQLGINVIRGLAMDAPRKASSGHSGTAMALAPLAHVLFTKVMRHDPSAPDWPDRDRFVLSCGHASILLYSMLHLTGYGLTLDDIKAFRQWGSRTPGHPEVHHTPGVEVTTGPLGQGFANGVGMGIAERWLRARFSPEVCDHHTFVICSDGDLEEGISHEAASMAGHLGLGRLVYVYDDNHISIDGPTELALSDDAGTRFEGYHWHVDRIGEAFNDTAALEAALRRAMAVEDQPSLIILRSHIGWPAPNLTDSPKAHGDPFPPDEIRATKEILGLPPDEDFWVPDEVLAMYRECIPRGQAMRAEWDERIAAWTGDRATWELCLAGRGAAGWQAKLPVWEPGEELATRVAVNHCINATLDVVPSLIAGGADLTGNTGTKLNEGGVQSRENPAGRQIYYGIREHGMGGVMNGLALHGGTVPVGGTFFNFSDYMRGAVRLAALSEAHVIYSWTHDSVGLGEDGPTHQPVEQLAAMRATPQLCVIRPADPNETAQAYAIAVDRNGPTALILTRQAVPTLAGTGDGRVAMGAYVLVDADGPPRLVLIGTGSEVSVCVEAARRLVADGVATRVVSMPSWELFEEQSEAYRRSVLPVDVPRLSVEAASSVGWARYASASVALDRFGASAPGSVALANLGFTPENVVGRANDLLRGGAGT
ncbi:MAG: transketolase [Acidimicrobiales bacterium]|nr:transketolase [Acidimicrobiales bacterium]